MKLAEYQAKLFSVVTEKGKKKIIIHATDGTKVVITLGGHQHEIAERGLCEAPCA
jgi:hypothetical protein